MPAMASHIIQSVIPAPFAQTIASKTKPSSTRGDEGLSPNSEAIFVCIRQVQASLAENPPASTALSDPRHGNWHPAARRAYCEPSPASARYRSPCPDSATSTRCLPPSAIPRSPDGPTAPGRRCRRTCPAHGRPRSPATARRCTAGSRSSKSAASSAMPESRSRPSVSWVRSLEPIEKPSKCSRNCSARMALRRHFAHHDQAQAVFAALQAVLGQQVDHLLRLAQRAHERHHDLDVGQAHVVAHALHRHAFHLERLGEVVGQVARRAAETQHRVFLVRLVARTADQLLVLVRLEVGQAHDHRLRPERGGDGGDAFGQLVDVERLRRGMAARHRFHRLLQVRVDVRVLENRLRMNADVVVDDELEPRQADAVRSASTGSRRPAADCRRSS